MSLTRPVRLTTILVVLATGSGVALAGSAAGQALPSAAALAALNTLSQPSHALSIARDQRTGDHRWLHPGTCDVVQASYHAPDAPIPAGSTTSDDQFHTILVQSPFGTSAIMFEEQLAAGRCLYSIERAPTVRAVVPELIVADQFSPVACTNLLGTAATFVTLITDQGEWTGIVVAPADGGQFRAAFAPGPQDVVSKLKAPPANGVEATGDATFVGDHLSFTGTSPRGPVTVEATCTPDQFLQVPA